ncbi:HAD family acid phosphatase [Mycoplasma sp. 005V]|uniref:HAD family acid phosphatase n=1 Tax=Mycoplasma sp. 005V TaxID=3398776 RepID=UPI003A891DB8
MNKIKSVLLSFAGISAAVLPIVASSCSNTEDTDKIKKLEGQVKELQAGLESKTTELATAKSDAEQSKKKADDLLSRRGKTQEITSDLWNSFSSEKYVTGLQTYRLAKMAFDAMIKQDNVSLDKVNATGDTITVGATDEGKFVPVVWMDLDDTVLNNFLYQNWSVVTNQTEFSSSDWTKYVNTATAKEVAGAIEFIKYVWSKGGVVMFNSNRKQVTEMAGTVKNLEILGLDKKYMPDWIWFMAGENKVSAQSPYSFTNRNVKVSKEERMTYVNKNKLPINGKEVQFKSVVRIGDDISDFNDNFTKGKINGKFITTAQVIDGLKSDKTTYGKLFANVDITVKGVYYDATKSAWVPETQSESYVLVSGNESYGTWVRHLMDGGYSIDYDKAIKLLSSWQFDPNAKPAVTPEVKPAPATPAQPAPAAKPTTGDKQPAPAAGGQTAPAAKPATGSETAPATGTGSQSDPKPTTPAGGEKSPETSQPAQGDKVTEPGAKPAGDGSKETPAPAAGGDKATQPAPTENK